VYIAHVLVFAVIFLVALNYHGKHRYQTIDLLFIDAPPAMPAALPTAALPSPAALIPHQQDYEVSFKRIFNGGKNIDSTGGQGATWRHQIKQEANSHEQPQLTKTNPTVPFKLPSPHFTKPPLALPPPILPRPPLQQEIPPLAPPEIADNYSTVVPLPELGTRPYATEIPVLAPLPQPVLKTAELPVPSPIPHDQTYFQPDLAPVAVPFSNNTVTFFRTLSFASNVP
jgi:hypothetical protein